MEANCRQDKKEIAEGLSLFSYITLAIVCLLTFLFMVFYLIFSNTGTNNPLDTPDKSQTLAALFTLIFGSAAAIGGAIATIHVASLGLEISKRQQLISEREEQILKRQELHDSNLFLDQKTSKAIELFSDLLFSINQVYSAGVVVYIKMLNINPKEAHNWLTNEMLQLSDKLLILVEAINNILKDDFSNYCIQQKVLNFNGKLEHLSKGQIKLGLESSEVDISIKDFSVITALLELAGRNIKECRSKDLICTNFVTNLSDNELFNMKYNNLNVRSFFFTGNLINLNYRLNECTPTGKIFVASLGAAILCDLTQIVPRCDDILKYLEQKYPNNSALAIHEVFFEPDSIISKGLLTAIKDTEQIGDLYLLIGDAALNNSNSGTETTQIIN